MFDDTMNPGARQAIETPAPATTDDNIDDRADAIVERLGGEDEPAGEDHADAPAAAPEGTGEPAADAVHPSVGALNGIAAQIAHSLSNDSDVRAVLDPIYAADLANDDPIEFTRAQGRGQRKLMEAQGYVQAVHHHTQAAMEQELAKVAKFAPELVGDGAEAKAARAEVRAFLKAEGFSEAEISGITDARVLRTVMKSFRAAKALENMRPARNPSPTVRPGSRNATRAEKVARAIERTTDLRTQADLIASIL